MRIESTSSEEESSEQNKEQAEVKVDKSPNVRTYTSPKSKGKVKIEKSPLNGNKALESKKNDSKKVAEKTVVITDREDVEVEDSEKSEVVKKSRSKSPSPEKARVKEEKATPEPKKGAKNVMSFFVKKEVDGKSESEGKEGVMVAGKIFFFHICSSS